MQRTSSEKRKQAAGEVLGLISAGALVFVGVVALMGFYLGSGND